MSEPDYKQPDILLVGSAHVERYRETDGAEGYLWNGVPTLLLTTTGSKSGEPRTTPLIFARDGEDYLVVASMGGAPRAPKWFGNLQVDPEAEIQVKAEKLKVTGRAATADEQSRLWTIVNEQWPNYEVYQSRTDRPIPVVVLTPLSSDE